MPNDEELVFRIYSIVNSYKSIKQHNFLKKNYKEIPLKRRHTNATDMKMCPSLIFRKMQINTTMK